MKYTVKIIGHLRDDGSLAKWVNPTELVVATKTSRAAACKAVEAWAGGYSRVVCEVEGKHYLGTSVRKMRVTSWKGEV